MLARARPGPRGRPAAVCAGRRRAVRQGGRGCMTQVHHSIADQVMTVVLDGPDSMNSLTPEALAGLEAALDIAESDLTLRAMVVTATGERAFCVGMDIDFLGECFADPLGVFLPFLRRYDAVLGRLEGLGFPVIAQVGGLARAGGLELILACDFVVAADEARVGRHPPGLRDAARRGWQPTGAAQARRPAGQAAAADPDVAGRADDGRVGAGDRQRPARRPRRPRWRSCSPCCVAARVPAWRSPSACCTRRGRCRWRRGCATSASCSPGCTRSTPTRPRATRRTSRSGRPSWGDVDAHGLR